MSSVRLTKVGKPTFSLWECRDIVYPSNREDARLQTDVSRAAEILLCSPSAPEFPPWLILPAAIINIYELIEEYG
jgi:hypothetical protein